MDEDAIKISSNLLFSHSEYAKLSEQLYERAEEIVQLMILVNRSEMEIKDLLDKKDYLISKM